LGNIYLTREKELLQVLNSCGISKKGFPETIDFANNEETLELWTKPLGPSFQTLLNLVKFPLNEVAIFQVVT